MLMNDNTRWYIKQIKSISSCSENHLQQFDNTSDAYISSRDFSSGFSMAERRKEGRGRGGRDAAVGSGYMCTAGKRARNEQIEVLRSI